MWIVVMYSCKNDVSIAFYVLILFHVSKKILIPCTFAPLTIFREDPGELKCFLPSYAAASEWLRSPNPGEHKRCAAAHPAPCGLTNPAGAAETGPGVGTRTPAWKG